MKILWISDIITIGCTFKIGVTYMKSNNNQVWRMIYLITQIGFTMLTTIFICIGLGYLIDRWFNLDLMVWFIILGVVAGFRSTYILIRKFIGHDDGKS